MYIYIYKNDALNLSPVKLPKISHFIIQKFTNLLLSLDLLCRLLLTEAMGHWCAPMFSLAVFL